MYKQLETEGKDYETKWLEAERELAISSAKPVEEHEIFTREDLIKSLKRTSRRIEKSKSSLKPSKT